MQTVHVSQNSITLSADRIENEVLCKIAHMPSKLAFQRQEGYIELSPANPNFKPIRIDSDDSSEIWGVDD